MKIKTLKDSNNETISPLTSTKSIFDENNNRLDVTISNIENTLSEVYENYDAIINSGETNTNKIYIDGETNVLYKYSLGNFEIIAKNSENTGYTKLTWDNSTNANNIKEAGLYIIDGVHSNSGDNLPTTAYANGYIGGFMSVTVSTKDEELNEQIIGQNLSLSNKVSGETKQYIRSCIIKNGQETWSAWKEVNTIQMFGIKSSGIATKSDIDAAIDNGQYAGVYMDADGFLPQGATFTLTVINNYAATAASSLPANYRQVTQMFVYTPLSTDGSVKNSVVCKRDGIGGNSISWGELESVGGNIDLSNYLTKTEQSLTSEEKTQVQKNIGVDVLIGDINTILDNINGEIV